MNDDQLIVSLCQVSPIWLNKKETIEKLCHTMDEAGKKDSQLVVFGEALIPGYPFWLELTDGASFNSIIQKEIYAHYLNEAVDMKSNDLGELCELAKKHSSAIITGIVEKSMERAGHSLYCTLVHISNSGEIINTHRKLMPTYEERLVWATGDGHGLNTFPLGKFHVGALNCWENWMPLARTSLNAQGEDLHVALWPGQKRNTEDITQYMAKEGRSYILSVSGVLKKDQIPKNIPHADLIIEKCPDILANGGSCIASPDGSWVIPPQFGEGIFTAALDHKMVRMERQNFDPTGHYSRPDVLQLTLNKTRQKSIEIINK